MGQLLSKNINFFRTFKL